MLTCLGENLDNRGPDDEHMEAIDEAATPPSAQANINTVIAIEEEALQKRTPADRILSKPSSAAQRHGKRWADRPTAGH